ncbi:hypothetical protein N7G274_010368 [Stereocaulon virgatum]|uniref:Uncharacterized protein n=1 Tax=Stereocaulon virgatum TaxID=373712 RepID=A0ABR3ZUK8_9LECA
MIVDLNWHMITGCFMGSPGRQLYLLYFRVPATLSFDKMVCWNRYNLEMFHTNSYSAFSDSDQGDTTPIPPSTLTESHMLITCPPRITHHYPCPDRPWKLLIYPPYALHSVQPTHSHEAQSAPH